MELYLFILCFSIFILLTIGLSFLLYLLYQAYKLNIKNGSYDTEIIENTARLNVKPSRFKIICNIACIILSIILLVGALYFAGTKDNPVKSIPMPKVVLSGSMSYKHSSNQYLIDNNLNDQILTSDLIFLEKLPDTLTKYDIVLYKSKHGILTIHRIVDIIKSAEGDDVYIFQGDAKEFPDSEQVSKEQLLGIYRGKHIPYLGHFIRFLQSYVGILCIILIVVISFAYPILNKKLETLKKERLLKLK